MEQVSVDTGYRMFPVCRSETIENQSDITCDWEISLSLTGPANVDKQRSIHPFSDGGAAL